MLFTVFSHSVLVTVQPSGSYRRRGWDEVTEKAYESAPTDCTADVPSTKYTPPTAVTMRRPAYSRHAGGGGCSGGGGGCAGAPSGVRGGALGGGGDCGGDGSDGGGGGDAGLPRGVCGGGDGGDGSGGDNGGDDGSGDNGGGDGNGDNGGGDDASHKHAKNWNASDDVGGGDASWQKQSSLRL